MSGIITIIVLSIIWNIITPNISIGRRTRTINDFLMD